MTKLPALLIYNQDKNVLSRENCVCIKGLFAISVLVHHLYQYSGVLRGYLIGNYLQALGSLSVAMFFFLSGYGLYSSYLNCQVKCKEKGNSYLQWGGIKSKILRFYIVIVFFTIVYIIFNLLRGESMSLKGVIRSLLFGGTIIINGWYLQVQLLLYIEFYIVFTIANTHKILWMFFAVFIYSVLVFFMLDGSVWYEKVPFFIIGMVCSHYKEMMTRMLKKYWLLCFVCGMPAFIMLHYLGMHSSRDIAIYIYYFMGTIAYIVGTLGILYAVRIDNVFMKWIGTISLEIYALQGVFLVEFQKIAILNSNAWLYIICVVIATVALSFLLHPAVKKIQLYRA